MIGKIVLHVLLGRNAWYLQVYEMFLLFSIKVIMKQK